MRQARAMAGLVLLLIGVPPGYAQDRARQPCPHVTDDTLGCELVVWSQLQDPVPLPDLNSPSPLPDQQSDPKQAQSSSQAQRQPSRQTITGVIVRERGACVFKVEDGTIYQLEGQISTKQYENRQVKVVGRLDANHKILYVEGIELVSRS